MNHSPPTVYFSSEGQLVHTNATLSARISPQWLSELDEYGQVFPEELCLSSFSLIGCHPIVGVGQHSLLSLTLSAQRTWLRTGSEA